MPLNGQPQPLHRRLLKLYLERLNLIEGHELLETPRAESFPSAGQLAWRVGVCPGLQESAGESTSNRSAKGNCAMRRLLNQLAHAAVHKRDCYLQILFKRPSLRLGNAKAVCVGG